MSREIKGGILCNENLGHTNTQARIHVELNRRTAAATAHTDTHNSSRQKSHEFSSDLHTIANDPKMSAL